MFAHLSMALPSHEILSQLACDDPQAFEVLRDELVTNCIMNAPGRIQPRLCGIQFRVDSIRRLSRTPLGSLVKIQAMMWRSFLRLDEELQEFSRFAGSSSGGFRKQTGLSHAHAGSARIIEFRPRMLAERR